MALLGFIGFLSMSSQRMCITVALICMLNQTAMTDSTVGPPTPPPPLSAQPSVTVTGPAALLGNVTGADDNATAAAASAAGASAGGAGPTPVGSCGEIPEIFVLNTSDFSRFNVCTDLVH